MIRGVIGGDPGVILGDPDSGRAKMRRLHNAESLEKPYEVDIRTPRAAAEKPVPGCPYIILLRKNSSGREKTPADEGSGVLEFYARIGGRHFNNFTGWSVGR